ncbi:Bro-N domain-containing protein [Streptomyces sp. NPDC005263]|uniref:BRO-N domain-containing protein n=1 Tax=Streptomyces sp. NPDC005263 TaxID=3364711 RepID=UPI0036BD7E7D
MIEPSKRRNAPEQRDAIDVSDFVYAATGARVRRLTMPDGTHWFPAVDVCKELGHTNSRKALADHVPDAHREMLETVTGGYGLSLPAGRKATLAVQQAMVRAMERIADRLDALVLERRAPGGRLTVPPTTESLLADWRHRLSVTEDVWTVAVVIAPVLVEEGELREPLETIAARTGLPVRRVNECLRLLQKHACIRSQGGTGDGAPVYVLNQA